MNTEFKQREFEGENDTMHTFQGYNNSFCIMLNAKCIHSVKTKAAHEKMIRHLCKERDLKEIEQPDQYKICTDIRTSDGKIDQSEAAKKAMKLTANVTKTKDELKDFMIQWQKHKAKDFPAGKVIVTSFTKKNELHEQYSLCEDGKYQVVCRIENPKFYLESTKL